MTPACAAGLAGSVIAWAIAGAALAVHWRAQIADQRFLSRFWSGGALEDLRPIAEKERLSPAADLFGAALREWDRSAKHAALEGLIGRTADAVRLERAPGIWPDVLWLYAAAALFAGACGALLADPMALPTAFAVAAQATILGVVIARRERAAVQTLEGFGHALANIIIRSAPRAEQAR